MKLKGGYAMLNEGLTAGNKNSHAIFARELNVEEGVGFEPTRLLHLLHFEGS